MRDTWEQTLNLTFKENTELRTKISKLTEALVEEIFERGQYVKTLKQAAISLDICVSTSRSVRIERDDYKKRVQELSTALDDVRIELVKVKPPESSDTTETIAKLTKQLMSATAERNKLLEEFRELALECNGLRLYKQEHSDMNKAYELLCVRLDKLMKERDQFQMLASNLQKQVDELRELRNKLLDERDSYKMLLAHTEAQMQEFDIQTGKMAAQYDERLKAIIDERNAAYRRMMEIEQKFKNEERRANGLLVERNNLIEELRELRKSLI